MHYIEPGLILVPLGYLLIVDYQYRGAYEHRAEHETKEEQPAVGAVKVSPVHRPALDRIVIDIAAAAAGNAIRRHSLFKAVIEGDLPFLVKACVKFAAPAAAVRFLPSGCRLRTGVIDAARLSPGLFRGLDYHFPHGGYFSFAQRLLAFYRYGYFTGVPVLQAVLRAEIKAGS